MPTVTKCTSPSHRTLWSIAYPVSLDNSGRIQLRRDTQHHLGLPTVTHLCVVLFFMRLHPNHLCPSSQTCRICLLQGRELRSIVQWLPMRPSKRPRSSGLDMLPVLRRVTGFPVRPRTLIPDCFSFMPCTQLCLFQVRSFSLAVFILLLFLQKNVVRVTLYWTGQTSTQSFTSGISIY